MLLLMYCFFQKSSWRLLFSEPAVDTGQDQGDGVSPSEPALETGQKLLLLRVDLWQHLGLLLEILEA